MICWLSWALFVIGFLGLFANPVLAVAILILAMLVREWCKNTEEKR